MTDKKQISAREMGEEGSISASAQLTHLLRRDALYRQFEDCQRAVDNDVQSKPLVLWATGVVGEANVLSESQSSLLSPVRTRG